MAEGNSVKQEVPCAEGLGAFFFLSWCRLLAHQSRYLQKQKPSLAEIQIRNKNLPRLFEQFCSMCHFTAKSADINVPQKGQGIVILLSNKHCFWTC